MNYKNPLQPLCHHCGKPIAKLTRSTVLKSEYNLATKYQDVVEGPLYSKADCQHKSNQQVVSVSYSTPKGVPGVRRKIHSFTTWDGESWADEFFCNGTCAIRFAYVMARAGTCTNSYNEAIARRRKRREVEP
jgi:hypothetical protein